ncbi:MAG: RNB domain-containing ribonuclease [Spirochaetaceae bacterium]|jgi:exoribonuclease-2|nr:RNB domain-containing ribonuclease [Spirochaetaceae bacterium]
MIKQNSLAVYKGKCAIVRETGDKITISMQKTGEIKVREKDIIVLHPGPCTSLNALETPLAQDEAPVIWELLEAENFGGGKPYTVRELAELIWNVWTPESAWAAYSLLREGVYFSGEPNAIQPRSAAEVQSSIAGRAAKEREVVQRGAFLERLKIRKLDLPADAAFLSDVEALAFGKTDKSKTMRDAGLGETPVEAHKLLLCCGAWDVFVNPFPSREGLLLKQAAAEIAPPPEEERADLSALEAFAIDNADSADPDDALSIERQGDIYILYVHVSDPAASILPGSGADVEARNRGATAYLPEGVYRMLKESALPVFALGLSQITPALTFKLKLGLDGSLQEIDIFPSYVQVQRLTYCQADRILNGSAGEAEIEGGRQTLALLKRIAELNVRRRLSAGASIIDFPEVHITVKDGVVAIEPQKSFESAVVVRECMLMAGEGAARWALSRRLPFPYVSQETGDVPKAILDGLAGSYQLRRCMRPRLLSVKPSLHWGLGLDIYTQVTSPLRRYTDLVCHEQIRAALAGRQPLGEDEVLARLAVAERGSICAMRAERASCAHWTRVFLSDKIGSVWDAVVLDLKGTHTVMFIPQLGLEVQAAVHGSAAKVKPNDEIKVKIASVKIAEGIINITGSES